MKGYLYKKVLPFLLIFVLLLAMSYVLGEEKVEEPKESKQVKVTEKTPELPSQEAAVYILNKSSHKIHKPTCGSVQLMKEENKVYYEGKVQDLYKQGYTVCKRCYH